MKGEGNEEKNTGEAMRYLRVSATSRLLASFLLQSSSLLPVFSSQKPREKESQRISNQIINLCNECRCIYLTIRNSDSWYIIHWVTAALSGRNITERTEYDRLLRNG